MALTSAIWKLGKQQGMRQLHKPHKKAHTKQAKEPQNANERLQAWQRSFSDKAKTEAFEARKTRAITNHYRNFSQPKASKVKHLSVEEWLASKKSKSV